MSPSNQKQQPLYLQIASWLRARIVPGQAGPAGALDDDRLMPGDALPTENALAEQWKTTRTTVKRALEVLINEGLIYADRPRGHFVRSRQPMVYRPQAEFRKRPLSPQMDSFMTDMVREGRTPGQTITIEILPAPAAVQERMHLKAGELVAVRRRIRLLDGDPYLTNDSYYPLAIVQGSEIMNPADIARGANQVLSELGYHQVDAIDEFEWRMPTPDEAGRLSIPPGTPVAEHISTGYTADGQVPRVVVNCLPGDRIKMLFERRRPRLGNELTVSAASPDDLKTVVELWEHAASWLKERGIDQWQYPPRTERIQENIAAGQCYLVWDGEVPVATVTVDEHADTEFWTSEEAAEPAFYVHRMAVRRDASRQELGSAMLDWASKLAEESGKRWLRLDAWKSNESLQAYYRARGFEHLRTVELERRGSGALFQRAAGVTRGVGPLLKMAAADAVPDCD
ncbi:GNAT family N-acetyltransferase [Kitasatospora sp. NPDC087861]|uniref:GNAT family N-acetyltransferase n=1 Tax=Kitasatospora sp. NPDC087861 TaxID=3364070 RepID=UPI00381ED621